MPGSLITPASPSAREIVRAELLALRQYPAFILRHRRYLVIFLAIYGRSLLGWRRARAARLGFCFLQLADDILDGDRRVDGEPEDAVCAVMREIETGKFGSGTLSQLARAFAAELEPLRKADEDPRDVVLQLCEAMIFDRRRAREGLLLTQEELRAQHRRTFALSVNILLISAGSGLRARDCPSLIEAFGWCSTVRDLEEDLARDLVNVPREVVLAAGGFTHAEPDAFLRSAPARNWLGAELLRAKAMLADAEAELARLRGRPGSMILELFRRSIARYARPGAAPLRPSELP